MNRDAVEGVLFWLPAFLFSTTVHEAAHAWVAMRAGDRTAYEGGQVSLSPWPHIRREPIGMLVVPVITSLMNGWAMGWASAPYDRDWARRFPRRAAWMAVAGPAGNLALAIVAFGLIEAGRAAGVFVGPAAARYALLATTTDPAAMSGPAGFAARGLSVLLTLNVLLAAFNLLPVPPLDGSTAIDLVLPRPLVGRMRDLGPMGPMIGILVAWRVFPFIARPLFSLVLNLLYPGQYS